MINKLLRLSGTDRTMFIIMYNVHLYGLPIRIKHHILFTSMQWIDSQFRLFNRCRYTLCLYGLTDERCLYAIAIDHFYLLLLCIIIKRYLWLVRWMYYRSIHADSSSNMDCLSIMWDVRIYNIQRLCLYMFFILVSISRRQDELLHNNVYRGIGSASIEWLRHFIWKWKAISLGATWRRCLLLLMYYRSPTAFCENRDFSWKMYSVMPL